MRCVVVPAELFPRVTSIRSPPSLRVVGSFCLIECLQRMLRMYGFILRGAISVTTLMDNFNSGKGFSISDLTFLKWYKALGRFADKKTEKYEMRKTLWEARFFISCCFKEDLIPSSRFDGGKSRTQLAHQNITHSTPNPQPRFSVPFLEYYTTP